jgi:tetratricopeptide (TPR) repeat protein
LDKYTLRKNKAEMMYKDKQYLEAANECAAHIAEIDIDDDDNFGKLSSLYQIMFNCYFKLSDKDECHKALNEWMKYAITDESSMLALYNRMRLCIVTGEPERGLKLNEELIDYYTDTMNKERVAKTLIWKGEATKEVKYYKEALKLLKQVDVDTSIDEAFALRKIKELRHLS